MKVSSHAIKYSPAIINTSGVQFMQSTSTPQQCLIRTCIVVAMTQHCTLHSTHL